MLKKLVFTIVAAALVATSCSNKYRDRSRNQQDKPEIRNEKTSDEAIYRQAADYVIAYYIKAYIDIKTTSLYKVKEFKSEWEILQSNSLKKPIPVEQLEQIIEKTPVEMGVLFKKGVADFYSTIKDKRTYSGEEWADKEALIDSLIWLSDKYKSWFEKELEKYQPDGLKWAEKYQRDSLRAELESFLPKATERKKSPPQPPGKAQKDSGSKSSGIAWWWWSLAAFAAVGLACAVRKRLRQKEKTITPAVKPAHADTQGSRNPPEKAPKPEEIRKNTLDVKGFEAVFKETLSSPNELQQFADKILKNEQLCRHLLKICLSSPEIVELLRKNKVKHTRPKPAVAPVVFAASSLYADAISGGSFNTVREQPNEDTVFVLNLQAPDMAAFTVYREAYSRVARRPEFLNGCDRQVLPNGQAVKIERLGEAQRLATGEWRIAKKLSVTIE